jgi:hypothetical protein
MKNRSNKDFWKVRMQRQIRNWRKEVYVLAESGSRSEIDKLGMKRGIFFRNIRQQRQRITQFLDRLKQKI